MTIFYFTSTGNCLHVAKSIGGTRYSIPQLMKEKKFAFEDDAIGLIYPVYGFGMPNTVRDFLSKVKWKAGYSFAVGTYGNMAAATLYQLEQLAARNGITFDYMNTLLMVDNYLPGFEMADQVAKLPQKNTDNNLKKIVSDINSRTKYKPAATIFSRAATALIQAVTKPLMSGSQAKNFIVNSECTKCGVCAKTCPTGNITVEDNVIFSEHCEGCLGCAHNCPQNAIHLKSEKSSARFRNENVTLQEIIKSNNRGQ